MAMSQLFPHRLRIFCLSLLAAAALSGCGSLPSVFDGEPAATGYATTRPAKRTRMSRQDILLEWSTVRIDKPFGKKKSLGETTVTDVLDEPDLTLSLAQIMADATCRACEGKPYHHIVLKASERHGVPASVIHAVIEKESRYNPMARSHRRAIGLMQVTPETARFVGVRNARDLYDPHVNIHAGTAYLRYLLGSHRSFEEVLAAYNAGPGNVRKYKGVPPFRETRRYVRDVKRLYAGSSSAR